MHKSLLIENLLQFIECALLGSSVVLYYLMCCGLCICLLHTYVCSISPTLACRKCGGCVHLCLIACVHIWSGAKYVERSEQVCEAVHDFGRRCGGDLLSFAGNQASMHRGPNKRCMPYTSTRRHLLLLAVNGVLQYFFLRRILSRVASTGR